MSLVSVLLCSFPTSIPIHFIHFLPKPSILDTVFVSDLDNYVIDNQINNLIILGFVVFLRHKNLTIIQTKVVPDTIKGEHNENQNNQGFRVQSQRI